MHVGVYPIPYNRVLNLENRRVNLILQLNLIQNNFYQYIYLSQTNHTHRTMQKCTLIASKLFKYIIYHCQFNKDNNLNKTTYNVVHN